MDLLTQSPNLPVSQSPCLSTNNVWFSLAKEKDSQLLSFHWCQLKLPAPQAGPSSLGWEKHLIYLFHAHLSMLIYSASQSVHLPVQIFHSREWGLVNGRMNLPFFSPFKRVLGNRWQVMDTIWKFPPQIFRWEFTTMIINPGSKLELSGRNFKNMFQGSSSRWQHNRLLFLQIHQAYSYAWNKSLWNKPRN